MVIYMSLWEKYLNKNSLPNLDKNIMVDTLIIGGGITGLTTLYYLKDYQSVCLVDAGLVGNGVTKNTTGKLTYLQNTIYKDLEKNVGYDSSIEYLKSQTLAITLIKDIITKEQIECNLEKVDSYVFTNKENELNKLKQEYEFLKNCVNIVEKKLPINVSSLYSISVNDTYVFNPIKYLNHLKNMLKDKIYEYTKIKKIIRHRNKYICYSDKYTIIADKIIVACHYPFFFIPFCLPLKSHIEKSYIITRKVKKNPKFSAITVSNPGMSIRYLEDNNEIYEICLASSHKTSSNQDDLKNFSNVKKTFSLKDNEIIDSWSNVDIITDDKLPYIGEAKKNFYIATGFNTWGMTNGIIAAYMLSRFILNEDVPFRDLFSINRTNFYQIKSFFSNTINSLKAFVGSKKRQKDWYSDNLKITTINGKQVGIYTDINGKEHIVYTTCPHMGCSLIFNELEHTWDCPCHSSRFSLDGKCLKGPSTKDITYKK